MKTAVSRRGNKGGKRLDRNQMRDLVATNQMVTALGVVRKFPGQSSHFEVNTENGSNEILIDVEIVPSGERVQCRLGFGDDGVYRIPRVNSEVAVLLPYSPQSLIKDAMDFEPIIVGVLDVNAPIRLTGDDIIVLKADNIAAESNTVKVFSPSIELGDTPNPLDGAVIGTGVDPFTGSTYATLGNISTVVRIKK